MGSLPDFIEPMLARLGEPFDSADHRFEIKWDGMRTLVFVEGGSLRLVNRQKNDVTERYRDLGGLARLPSGTVLDGEIVVLDPDGRPNFERLLRREQARRHTAAAARSHPACFAAFDVLYRAEEKLLDWTLSDRVACLAESVSALDDPRVVASAGVEDRGVAFFQALTSQGFEGVVAKRLDSRYTPGRRSDHWIKIKRSQTIWCAVIGYVADGGGDLRSLVLGAEVEGSFRHVGRVGSGWTEADRAALRRALEPLQRSSPVVPAEDREATWVEPTVVCSVIYLEKTEGGMLRAPRLASWRLG